MKEHPILFSAPMVLALLAGSKTQTRRVVKPQPEWDGNWFKWDGHRPNSKYGACSGNSLSTTFWMLDCCPYGKPGDRLWVRETHFINHYMGAQTPVEDRADCQILYRATDMDCVRNMEDSEGLVWSPSIHMPRWASRITLEITGVRVERLQDISEADCWSEGAVTKNPNPPSFYPVTGLDGHGHLSTRGVYADLWRTINGPESWGANPWVWVVEFKAVQPS